MFHDLPASTQPLVLSAMGVRRAIGIAGLILPVVLGPVGWLVFAIPIQDNLSYYVHTPMRDVYVGICFALGVLLFCYRGHDRLENWTANLACIFALGLALLPLDPGSDPMAPYSVAGLLHTVCGGGFFLTLATYALLHFPRTTHGRTEDEPHRPQRNLVYRGCGIVILLSMLAMGAYLVLLPAEWKRVSDR